MSKQDRNQKRQKRRIRVRKKITGTAARPRLSIVRSLKHISAQVIDDDKGHAIVAASSLSKDLREELKGGGNKSAARVVGKKVAELAKAQGVDQVVFDRGGYVYHGRVKELADGAREGGLKF